LSGSIRGQNTARDFGAHADGVGFGQHPARDIAFNLGQLVAIDLHIMGGTGLGWRAGPTGQGTRQQHGHKGGTGGGDDPETHKDAVQ
jgi:hypothetical protein